MRDAAATIAFARGPRGDAWLGVGARWTPLEIAAALINVAAAGAIVWFFHDRFWWPPDDGAYAYIADRLRNGAVLNRDLHDVHAGYVHFLHAYALDLFGRDILSLRYPLTALTVVQSALVFLLLRPLIGPAALAGGVAMSALTFVQFLNPTANWYALFLTVLLTGLLGTRAHRSTIGLVAIGFLVAMILLFRQLTGVLVGIGAVAYLLSAGATPQADGDRKPYLSWAIYAATTLALAAYLWSKTDSVSFALFGLWPLAVLMWLGYSAKPDSREVVRIVALLLAGAIIAALPLALYHLSHGSLADWVDDTVLSAVSLTDLDFFRRMSYAVLLAAAVQNLVALGDSAAMLNGAFWLIVLLSPAALGIAVLQSAQRDGGRIHPLPLIALFHALVSAHYAIPIYALYSAGLSLVGLLALAHTPRWRKVMLTVTLFAACIGVGFQAAQPLSRGLDGIMRGTRIALDAAGLPGASVRMEARDGALYLRLLQFIDEHASPQQTILGLPMTPELYFLSGRNPPTRMTIAPLSLRTPSEVNKAKAELLAAMPAVVVFKPDDKYTTPRVRELMRELQPHYRLCKTIGAFELYAPACRS